MNTIIRSLLDSLYQATGKYYSAQPIGADFIVGVGSVYSLLLSPAKNTLSFQEELDAGGPVELESWSLSSKDCFNQAALSVSAL